MSKAESATKNNGWKFATKHTKKKAQKMRVKRAQQRQLCAYIWIHVKHFYYICSNQFRRILQVILGKIENWLSVLYFCLCFFLSPALLFFVHSVFLLLCKLGQNPIFFFVVLVFKLCWWISISTEFLFIAGLVVWLSFSFQFAAIFFLFHSFSMQRFMTIPCDWTHDRWTDVHIDASGALISIRFFLHFK